MKRLNKKGFTLVELLAVIVILALIMAIAIYSISGILQSSRENIFKDNGLVVIRGVKNQLLALNRQEAGTYYFTKEVLDNDNALPFGGKVKFATEAVKGNDVSTGISTSSGKVSLYKAISGKEQTNCDKDSVSYVNVRYIAGTYEYSVCLIPENRDSSTVSVSSGRFLAGTETELLGNTEKTIFAMNESKTLSSPSGT